MLRTASSFQDFGFPSGARDLLFSGLAEGVRTHGQCNFQFAITQNLNAIALGANDSLARKRFGSDRFAGRERIERLDVDDGKLLRIRAAESALGQATVKRHLAAFESGAA